MPPTPSLTLLPGRAADYTALARFHYRPGRPATFAAVWTIVHTPPRWSPLPPRPAAVAVLSYPTLSLHIRDRVLNLSSLSPPDKHCFVNTHIRTISRVIVHPAYRSLGLARQLIHHILHTCNTRYVEALALMGHLHPMFQNAGMTPHPPQNPNSPIYYLVDVKSEM